MIDVHAVNGADEPAAERDPVRDWTEHIAEERDPLCLAELVRRDFLHLASFRDRGSARGAQVAHPLHLSPWRPHPAAVVHANHCERSNTGSAGAPTLDRYEPVEPQRDAILQ